MEAKLEVNHVAAPFVKWAGGKRQLLPHLLPLVPDSVRTGKARYFEPFLGGGALFFAVQPKYALLSDSNQKLMTTYEGVRDYLPQVTVTLDKCWRAHDEAHYYRRRDAFNIDVGSISHRAALFIYLNKTGFNGLYRVNRRGEFNVPFGRYAKTPALYDADNIDACSKALKAASLRGCGFVESAERASRGDFVYFDPPYVPLTASSDFTGYTADGFSDADQVRLRNLALHLKKRGVKVVLSNSSAERVIQLYARGFNITYVDARRAVNSDASKRGKVKEVIIT